MERTLVILAAISAIIILPNLKGSPKLSEEGKNKDITIKICEELNERVEDYTECIQREYPDFPKDSFWEGYFE